MRRLATAAQMRAMDRHAVEQAGIPGTALMEKAGAAVAAEAGCDVIALDGQPLRYDLAGGLLHPGFVVVAPGGGREACLRALAAGVTPAPGEEREA